MQDPTCNLHPASCILHYRQLRIDCQTSAARGQHFVEKFALRFAPGHLERPLTGGHRRIPFPPVFQPFVDGAIAARERADQGLILLRQRLGFCTCRVGVGGCEPLEF